MVLTQASRARNALWLMFFVMGVVSMAWVPRIPEIETADALTDTQFGLVLVASSVGAVLGAQLSGRAIHRFGSGSVIYKMSESWLPAGSWRQVLFWLTHQYLTCF